MLKNYFSNADGSSVKTEADLVKLRKLYPGYYQTEKIEPQSINVPATEVFPSLAWSFRMDLGRATSL